MTVTEFLLYLGELRGSKRSDLLAHLPKVINICQLQGREHQVIEELSLGYRKRVGIAQAIIHQPSLVILDEPISGLDPAQIVEMRKVIRSLSEQSTVLLSSHNLTEVEETCDRMLVLHDGKLIAQGTTESLSQGDGTQQIELCLHSTDDALSTVLDNNQQITVLSREREDQVINLTVSTDLSAQELVRVLVQAEIGISKVLPASSELEHIFLSLTTRPGGH